MARRLSSILHRSVIGKSIENSTKPNTSRQIHEEESKDLHRHDIPVRRLLAVALSYADCRENPVEDRVEKSV